MTGLLKDLIKQASKTTGVYSYIQNYRIKKKVLRDFKLDYSSLLNSEKSTNKRFALNESDFYPSLNDKTSHTWFDRHYIYHPAWAARILNKNKPEFHVDISSTLNFCAITSAFIPVKFYDYRPANISLTNLTSESADLTNLHFEDNSINSLSCMHTIEHVGLGRYGDPIDYDGDIKAANELSRVLAPNGTFLFVTPIGKESKIHFNSHRVYSKDSVLKLFPKLKLIEFTLIPEDVKDGGLIENPSQDLLERQKYGCGCFWFSK